MIIGIDEIKNKPGFFLVTPHGTIDNDSHSEFRSKINSILAASTKGILMDLKDVDYISSAGLGVLFTIKKHMLAQQGDLVFCNLKPQITKLFEIVKTLPKETLFKDLEEADIYFYAIMNEEIRKEKLKKKG